MMFQKMAETFAPILKEFLEAYIAKDPNLSNKDWLKVQLTKQALGIAETKVQEYCESIVGSVDSYNSSLQSLHESVARGKTPEAWMEDKLVQQGKMGVEEIGYLSDVMDGNYKISVRNMNAQELGVDALKSAQEYIGERYCIDSFNEAAGDNNYYAQHDEGSDGSVYGRNQSDIVIIDKRTGKPIDNYMVKFGNTPKETIDMISVMGKGGFKFIVPQEQLQEVQQGLPGIGISDRMIMLGKPDSLVQPLTVQIIEKTLSGELWKTGKNYLKTYQKKGLAGLAKKTVSDIVSLATSNNSVLFNEKNYLATNPMMMNSGTSGLIQQLLEKGDSTGIKIAASGAMTSFVKKGLTKLLPKNTPVGIIATIASAGVDIAGNMINVATGKTTLKDAIKECTLNQVASIGESLVSFAGKKWLAAPLAAIPVVGPYLSLAVTTGLTDVVADKIGVNFKSVLKNAKPLVKSVTKLLGLNRKNGLLKTVSKEVAKALS